jgi:putative oxidoreductase
MKDLGLLILRLIAGGLMAGHGAQKLFGWFGGGGLEGTAGMMEKMRLQPPKPWAILAGLSEFGGGLLTALGALGPVGPIGTISSMEMATLKAHWGKPIWVTKGGAELPLTNIGIALAVALLGPGKYSVDHALGLRVPRRLILVPGLLLAGAGVAAGMIVSNRSQIEEQPQARAEAERENTVSVPASPQPPSEWERLQVQSEQEPEVTATMESEMGQQSKANPS